MTEEEIRADRHRIVRVVHPQGREDIAGRQRGAWLKVNVEHPDAARVVTVPDVVRAMGWSERRIAQLEEINGRLATELGLLREELKQR